MNNLTREECYDAYLHLHMDGTDLFYLSVFSQLIEEHFDNPPLKFSELTAGMWVWDNSEYEKNYALIKNITIISDGDRLVGMKQDENDCDCVGRIFDENRFYRREVTGWG